jgi:Rrf2 family protein
MKITAQEEYGLRCLLQLAQGEPHGLTVREIAEQEGLSPAYTEKLLRILAKAGLIHSVRGVHGGYLLSRKPAEISLMDVVRALDSFPTVQEICGRYPGKRFNCIHIDHCCVRSVWSTLTNAIERFMSQVHISDLMGSEPRVRRILQQRVPLSFTV